ncbi:MAG: glycosyltransferase [Candidatus Buchananbacteria bacterium]
MENDYKIDLSVIAPCYNESKNVIELTERLIKTFEKGSILGEVILVNDGSQDNTWELIEELSKKFENVKAVDHLVNRGIVSGWNSGLDQARGKYVCLIDADLQNLPEDVLRMYREINFSNCDLVQGVRTHIGHLSKKRYFSTRGLNFLLNFVFRMRSRDNKSGFILCRKEVLQDILNHRFHYYHYQTFITVAAMAKRYSIREIDTLFQSRQLGKSYISGGFFNRVTFQTLADVAKGIFEFRFVDSYNSSLREIISDHQPARRDTPLSFWRCLWWRLYVVTFPFHHWMISYNAAGYLKDMKQTQWLTLDELKKYQEKQLRKLINQAYYHVPFYREYFQANNLTPEDIKTIDDLPKLPIIDKRIVTQNLYSGLIADNCDKKKMLRVTTSGSTGEPFVVFASKRQLEMRWAATRRSLEWMGYRFGDRQLRLWHKYLGMRSLESVKEILEAFLARRKFIPAYEMSADNLDKFVKKMEKFKPVILDGYAESYNLIANYFRHRSYNGPIPKGIMSSAQTLPDESRKIIEEKFHCKVFDKYGSREFAGGIAYECEQHQGYHIVAECNIIEIIKDGRPALPGEIGEVVVTELNNFDLPLIRYKLGDLAMQIDNSQTCSCGRGLPRLGAIQGRAQATIVGTSRQFIPGTFFARLFADHSYAVKQFQVVQDKFGEVTINIVKANLFTDEVLSQILKTMKKFMGEDLVIHINYVDQIALGRTGKMQHSVSHLDLNFDHANILDHNNLINKNE